jgi:hypothetical protein
MSCKGHLHFRYFKLHAEAKTGEFMMNYFFLILLFVITPVSIYSQDVRVVGTVVATNGQPISNATITLLSGGIRIKDKEPILNGQINLSIKAGGVSLSCIIEAPEFQSRRLNLDIINGNANAGKIALRPIPGLLLSKISHLYGSDRNQESVEVEVTNETNRPIVLTRVRLVGTRKERTDCYDPSTPEITFRFEDGIRLSRGSSQGTNLTVITRESARQFFVPKARVEFLKCDQIRLDLTIDYLFTLDSQRPEKIALVLPLVLEKGRGPRRVPLGLDSWDKLVLYLVQDGGRTFSSSK